VELDTADPAGHLRAKLARHRLGAADDGTFTFRIPDEHTNWYVVRFLGGSGLDPAGSRPLHAAVLSLIDAKADRTQVRHGGSFAVTADIRPAYDREGAWVVQNPAGAMVAMGRTDSRGHITFRVAAPDKPGDYDYAVACGVMNGDNQTEASARSCASRCPESCGGQR
jgi:hypothetical protein